MKALHPVFKMQFGRQAAGSWFSNSEFYYITNVLPVIGTDGAQKANRRSPPT